MGVSYYQCENPDCGQGFTDNSDYCFYCGCGSKFCSTDCGEQKFEQDGTPKSFVFGDEHEEYDLPSTCIFCRRENVEDEVLMKWLLKKTKLTRNKAVKQYLKEYP